jgi:hypothetical protein
MIVGDGTTDPVAESGATLRTSIGVGTGDSPQFAEIELSHGSDNTLTASSGELSIEGNVLYRAGGTDMIVADGGTGAGTFTDGGILFGNGTDAIEASAVLAAGEILIGDGSGQPAILDVGSAAGITVLGTVATGTWQGTAIAQDYIADDAIGDDHLDPMFMSSMTSGAALDGLDLVLLRDPGVGLKSHPLTDFATLFAGTGMTATSAVMDVIGGDGITANSDDIAITPVQTTISSVKNNSLVIGGNSQNNTIDFGTDDEILFDIDNTEKFKVTAAGVNVTGDMAATGAVTGTSSNFSSDRRFKKNITPVASALEKLSKLNPVNYDWRRDEFKERGFSDKKQWGFIAQEIEKVMPELVREDKNGYLSLNYNGVIPLLTKAMQEQQTEMEKQQKEIDELKAQLQSIMKMLDNDMSDKTDDKKADDNKKPVKLSMATVK